MARLLALMFACFLALPAVAQPDFNSLPTTEQDSLGASRGAAEELDTKLSTLYFGPQEVGLSPENVRELDRLIRLMKAHPDLVVNVFGHSDDVGSLSRIQELSDLRAQMVQAYLIANGISLDRIYSMGFGYRQPASKTINAEGRAMNRRVEVHIDYFNHK